MLLPVFTLKLNMKINPRMMTLGYFDGSHPSLACATTAGKVFVHNPHASRSSYGGRLESGSNSSISMLNINQTITAIASGSFKTDDALKEDMLFVGTPTNFLAYNIHANSDLFYKDTPDGSNAIVVGKLGGVENPIAIAGGNCSIQGYDKFGNDAFWTVTGDNVCSLTMIDFNGDNQNELIVGSEDFDIRIFQEDAILAELTETDIITGLCPMNSSQFGYSLGNGTVGVYDRTNRLWRIKSKNQPIAVHSFDLDNDGVDELITGWSNGKFDVRSDRAGEVIFKDTMSSPIAGIVHGDYKMDSNDCLIVASTDGELRGFNRLSSDNRIDNNDVCSDISSTKIKSVSLMDTNTEQELLRELTQKRQNLLMELKNYEENLKASKLQRPSGLGELDQQAMGIIPAGTTIQTSLVISSGNSVVPPHVQLIVSTSNDTVIRAVVIFAEGIFEGESHVVHPTEQNLSSEICISLYPQKDVPVDLHIKAFVGYKSSTQFHVFELSRQLPKFSMYALIPKDALPDPLGNVVFKINERINRIVLWINQQFLLTDDFECKESELYLKFQALRSLGPLVISVSKQGDCVIRTDDMDMAAEIIQSLASFLNIEDLQVTADFPDEMEKLRVILTNVDEYHGTRQKLSAEMADYSNIIKNLIVRAEDARLMGDLKNMKKNYVDLYNFNRDLINGYKIRCNNHTELLNCLKSLNQVIQRAGKLRVGKYKNQVITSCRNSIKNNNVAALFKIISTGSL